MRRSESLGVHMPTELQLPYPTLTPLHGVSMSFVGLCSSFLILSAHLSGDLVPFIFLIQKVDLLLL